MNTVVIEIKNNSVQSIISTTEDLNICVLDYDNQEGNIHKPTLIMTKLDINNYIEERLNKK